MTRGFGGAGGERDPAPSAIVPERRYITVRRDRPDKTSHDTEMDGILTILYLETRQTRGRTQDDGTNVNDTIEGERGGGGAPRSIVPLVIENQKQRLIINTLGNNCPVPYTVK